MNVISGKITLMRCPVDMTPVLQQLEVNLSDHWGGEGVNSGQIEVTQSPTDCCEINTRSLSTLLVSKLLFLPLLLLATGERVYSPVYGTQREPGVTSIEQANRRVPSYRELFAIHSTFLYQQWGVESCGSQL